MNLRLLRWKYTRKLVTSCNNVPLFQHTVRPWAHNSFYEYLKCPPGSIQVRSERYRTKAIQYYARINLKILYIILHGPLARSARSNLNRFEAPSEEVTTKALNWNWIVSGITCHDIFHFPIVLFSWHYGRLAMCSQFIYVYCVNSTYIR